MSLSQAGNTLFEFLSTSQTSPKPYPSSYKKKNQRNVKPSQSDDPTSKGCHGRHYSTQQAILMMFTAFFIALPSYIFVKQSLNLFDHHSNSRKNIQSSLLSSSQFDAQPSLITDNNNAHNINLNPQQDDRSILSSPPRMYSREWKKAVQGTRDDVHIVFTSGCTGYQNWQAENLLTSWARIKHPGRITRVIAGCENDKQKLKANRTAVPNPQNRILFYFVPDYTPGADSNKGLSRQYRSFHYFNKPFGMLDWLTAMAKSDVQEDRDLYESVVICVDPDFILLRPLMFHTQEDAHAFAKEQGKLKPEEYDEYWVRKGHPVSQRYGIGPKWVKWGHCPKNRPGCERVDDRFAWNHYSVGPPYMMHTDDWLLITPMWVQKSPGALEKEPQPSILAEMYSYSIACAYYDLPHYQLNSMISDPGAGEAAENWGDLSWDFLSNTDATDVSYHKFHILHMCQGYWLGPDRNQGTVRLGGWNYHKGHIPRDGHLDCTVPLLVELPLTGAQLWEDNLVSQYPNLPKLREMLTALDRPSLTDDDFKLLDSYIVGSDFIDSQTMGLNREKIYGAVMGRKGLFEARDQSKNHRHRHVWALYHVYKYINEALANYKLKYCESGWKPVYELVLQQPESKGGGHRMNYVLDHYDDKKSWRGA